MSDTIVPPAPVAVIGLGNMGVPMGACLIKAGYAVTGFDLFEQARQTFANVGAVLEAAGSSFADVAKVTIFLTDVDDREKINPVRQEVFGETRPASTLVEVSRLAIPGAKIEVEAVAVVGS